MTDEKLIRNLIGKLRRSRERICILKSPLNFYASGLNYTRNHSDVIILKDGGEKAWEALLKELIIGVEDNDFDMELVDNILSGSFDVPDSIRITLRAHPNVKRAILKKKEVGKLINENH